MIFQFSYILTLSYVRWNSNEGHRNYSTCMGTSGFFSCYFYKGKQLFDFQFATMDELTFAKWGSTLRERICSQSKLFLSRVDLIEKGGKKDKSCFL